MLPRKVPRLASSTRLTERCICTSAPVPAHKMVQVELLSPVPSLGLAGERKIVSPGYARNKLVPSGQAAYVVEGKAVMPVRTVLLARASEAARMQRREQQNEADRLRREREDEASGARAEAERAQREVESRKAERDALDRLLRIGKGAIAFERRPIQHSPQRDVTGAGSTKGGEEIFGSVTTLDVQALVKELTDVSLEDDAVRFADSKGIVNGRVKATGAYNFIVQFKAIQQEAVLQVIVRAEQQQQQQ